MRFTTKTALCLAISTLGGTTAAYADDGYVPYYASQNYQYANMAPAQDAQGIPTTRATSTNAAPVQSAELRPTSDFYHYNNELWAAAGSSLLNYKETVKPIPDSDRGQIPSFAAGFDVMTRNDVYFAADVAGAFGNGHYNGAEYDSGTHAYDIPYETSTHETVVNVDTKLGQGFELSDYAMITPYFNFGWRYWDRDIQSNSQEDYQQYELLVGVMFQIEPINHLFLTAYGAGGTTVGTNMHTAGRDFNIGGSGIEKVGGKIGYDVTKRVEIFSTIDFDHFHYVASPVNAGALEPSSRTEDTTFRVGVGYHFR